VVRLLVTITRYFPAIGGAEIHTRELLRNMSPTVEPSVVAHWSTNRTDWLLGTTLRAPLRDRSYVDESRPVHLIAPSLGERLRTAPFAVGYYAFQSIAAPRLAATLTRHMRSLVGAPDLVHNVRAGREPLSVASWQFARERSIPFVLTPNHHPRWTGWRYQVYLDLYRKADALIAFTEHERRVLADLGVATDRVHVTGIGPILAPTHDAERARHKFGLSRPFIMFLGQKYPYKGISTLLQSGPMIWSKHPDVDLVFVGPRTADSMRLFGAATDPRIREFGGVDLQDKTDLLSACEMVCLPSAQESFGGVLVEGWAFGKPVVGGPAAAIGDVIQDGQDGYFVAEASPGVLAERLNWLLDRPALAAEFGAAGARKVQSQFTWDRLAARTESIYQSLR
jgi:glycosyltransferase involved in cell wall biosynthesis